MIKNEQWHVDPDFPLMVLDAQGREVAASVVGLALSSDIGELQANMQRAEARARMIAQAPTMAAQLRAALKFINIGFNFYDGDVFGVWNNDAQDCVSALEEIISQLDSKS